MRPFVCLSMLLVGLITAPADAKTAVMQVSQFSSCNTGTTCVVTFNSPIGPNHALFLVAFFPAGDNTKTCISAMGDGTFTVGPNRTAGGNGALCTLGLAYSVGGETTLTITISASAASGWKVAGIELSPVVIDGSGCSAQNAAANPQPGCNLTVQASSRNDILIQCIRGGTNTVQSIDSGYTIAFVSGPNACAYLANSTSGTAPSWTLNTSLAASVVGWNFSDTGGVTLH